MSIEERNKIIIENMDNINKSCNMFIGNFPNLDDDYDDIKNYLIAYIIDRLDSNIGWTITVNKLFDILINFYYKKIRKKLIIL